MTAPETFLDDRVSLFCGDNREVLRSLADGSIDSIVTDPPYALVSIVKRFGKAGSAPAKGNEAYQRASAGFMGKQWDTGEVAFDDRFWAACLPCAFLKTWRTSSSRSQGRAPITA